MIVGGYGLSGGVTVDPLLFIVEEDIGSYICFFVLEKRGNAVVQDQNCLVGTLKSAVDSPWP